jgi:hypothetical protein
LGSVGYGSLSHKSDSGNKEVEDMDQADESGLGKDVDRGLKPTTMWEIVSQNAGASVAYNKTVKADKEAALKRGKEPKQPLPFQLTWPGKPLDDVFAHYFFTNLLVGDVKTPPPLTNVPSATFGGPPTAVHVQLVLELLLLCWPNPQVPYVASDDDDCSPLESVARQRWKWLLLMTALLQQTSTEQKQLLLQQRGPLLMQLLYQVLLEDKGLGGAGTSELLILGGDTAWDAWYVMMMNVVDVNYVLSPGRLQWAGSVPMAVTMVLQNLLFESLPESWVDPKTARMGKTLALNPFGK